MRKSIASSAANAILLGPQRRVMAEHCFSLVESVRDDFFPGVPIWEAFMLFLIIDGLLGINEGGRAASASELMRATCIPKKTIDRKLAYLKRRGFIEQLGSRFVLSPERVNEPRMLRGFWGRLHKVRGWPKKVVETTAL